VVEIEPTLATDMSKLPKSHGIQIALLPEGGEALAENGMLHDQIPGSRPQIGAAGKGHILSEPIGHRIYDGSGEDQEDHQEAERTHSAKAYEGDTHPPARLDQPGKQQKDREP